jgi:hypothetical protein
MRDIMNEKWERDFGEPLQWIEKVLGSTEDVYYLICPKCNWDDSNFENEMIYNYCPCCGQRLLPPEEKE